MTPRLVRVANRGGPVSWHVEAGLLQPIQPRDGASSVQRTCSGGRVCSLLSKGLGRRLNKGQVVTADAVFFQKNVMLSACTLSPIHLSCN